MATITPLDAALGAEVTHVDLHRALDDETVAELRHALARHEVLFFPEAGLSPAEQVCLGRALGQLEVHPALDRLDDTPEVVVFDTTEGATTAEWWHSDETCLSTPPKAAMLQMVIAPPAGGATHWASMTAAYDALDDAVKARIESLHALHRSWWTPAVEAVHPVVRLHPESGRRCLFVNGIFTKRIVELEDGEGAELLAELYAHATRDEFTVRHDWRSGDIALWDECATQHRVDNDFGDARRRGHRIVLLGAGPT
jgi:taurine dioxygenase